MAGGMALLACGAETVVVDRTHQQGGISLAYTFVRLETNLLRCRDLVSVTGLGLVGCN